MANKSQRRRQEQAKKKAAKAAAMLQPGYRSKYAQRRLRPPILGQQRPRMRHGEGFHPQVAHGPGGDQRGVIACLGDQYGGWDVVLSAA